MTLLEVENLKVHYPVRGGWLGRRQYVRAVDGVSFHLDAGETLGLVGESGCGRRMMSSYCGETRMPFFAVFMPGGPRSARCG